MLKINLPKLIQDNLVYILETKAIFYAEKKFHKLHKDFKVLRELFQKFFFREAQI